MQVQNTQDLLARDERNRHFGVGFGEQAVGPEDAAVGGVGHDHGAAFDGGSTVDGGQVEWQAVGALKQFSTHFARARAQDQVLGFWIDQVYLNVVQIEALADQFNRVGKEDVGILHPGYAPANFRGQGHILGALCHALFQAGAQFAQLLVGQPNFFQAGPLDAVARSGYDDGQQAGRNKDTHNGADFGSHLWQGQAQRQADRQVDGEKNHLPVDGEQAN